MNEEWLSAELDGELTDSEMAAVRDALAEDAELAVVHDELRQVRSLLRGAAVEVPVGAAGRVTASVHAAAAPAEPAVAEVVSLPRRRRVPTMAAAAAALVIIASVVGGLGGPSGVPALGDVVHQHQAAAAVVETGEMPDDMEMDMDPMPMDEAMSVAPPMPADYAMQNAYRADRAMQFVFLSAAGEPVSLFRYSGEADVSDYRGGAVSDSAAGEMWSGPRADAYVAVIDGTGYVWFVVSSQPQDAMMAEMLDELPARSASVAERLREAADVAVGPYRFWN